MSGIGHNRGPALPTTGKGWQLHCWRKARADLLPQLPLEVIRLRVRRAKEIGLDYTSYATVRATTGHDIVAFLYSSNALHLFRADQALAAERSAKLAAQTGIQRQIAAQPPLDPAATLAGLAAQGLRFDGAGRAPGLLTFPALREAVRGLLGGVPGDRVLLVGDTAVEREWCAAGRLAGYMPAERFFA